MDLPFRLMSESEFDVVGFGTNAVDHLVRVPRFPEYNSKIELTEHTVGAGGEVASTMVGLARLGMRTAYVGRFGDDDAGRLGRGSLVDESVETRWTEVIKGATTQIAFILIDEQSGERTVIWKRDSKLSYTAAEAPIEAAVRGRILHLTPHDTAACIRMAKAAKDAGVIVSADVDNVFDGLEGLLPLVDICIMSADLPGRFLGIADHREGLRAVSSRFGCEIAGLTLGEEGSLLLYDGEFIESSGYAVPGGCVDTTGAGDAFRAGFLFGVLNGLSVEQCAESANAVAALKCRGMGARSTLPTVKELELLQKKYGL